MAIQRAHQLQKNKKCGQVPPVRRKTPRVHVSGSPKRAQNARGSAKQPKYRNYGTSFKRAPDQRRKDIWRKFRYSSDSHSHWPNFTNYLQINPQFDITEEQLCCRSTFHSPLSTWESGESEKSFPWHFHCVWRKKPCMFSKHTKIGTKILL